MVSSASLRRLARNLPFSVLIGALVGVGAGLSGTMLAAVRWFHDPSASVVGANSLVVLDGRHDVASFEALSRTMHTLDLAAYRRTRHTVQWSALVREASVECVSPTYFQALLPLWPVGSDFANAGTTQVAVLAQHFAALSPDAHGSDSGPNLTIGRRRFSIVGAAPPRFTGADTATIDIWIPFGSGLELCTAHGAMSGGGASVSVVGRLRLGNSLERAEQEARSLGVPIELLEGRRARQLQRELRLARWGFAGALLLLAIGCLNACGLCMSRVIRRKAELALRRQLGASSTQIVADQVAQLIPATLLSSLIALAAAHVSSALLFRSELSNSADLSISTYLLSSVALAAATMLFCGVGPSILALRAEVVGRAQTETMRTSVLPAGYVLLLVQAVAAFLLVVGGLTVWTGIAEVRRQAGFDVGGVGIVTLNLDRYALVDAATLEVTFDSLQRGVARIPGVERTAIASGGLLGSLGDAVFAGVFRHPPGAVVGAGGSSATNPQGPVLAVPGLFGMSLISSVSPEYFETVGTRVERGRTFRRSDDLTSEPVIIVGRTLADAVWQHDSAIGECAYLSRSSVCARVIGITEKRRPLSVSHDTFEAFIPLAQNRIHNKDYNPRTLLVRLSGDHFSVRDRIAALLRNTPGLPPASLKFVDELVRSQTATLSIASQFFSVFTLFGVVMIASGVYALSSFVTTQRRRELGMRSALGASRRRLLWTLGRRTCVITVIGITVGLTAAVLIGRTVGSMAVGVQPLSTGILGVAAIILGTAMLLGAAVPLLRAVASAPADCLRG
jgi:hypothetical protein